MTSTTNRPWLRHYGAVQPDIEYLRVSLYEAVTATAQRLPASIACNFFGAAATGRDLLASIGMAETPAAGLVPKSGGRPAIDPCCGRLIGRRCRRAAEIPREPRKTPLGKVDFKVLVAEHVARQVR